MPELLLTHHLTYDISGDASVSDVANSLLANERMIRFSSMILEECIEGFHVDSVNVKVKQVTHQSPLKELLAFALVVTFQEDLAKEVPPFIEGLLGTDIPDQYDHLVTVLTMILAIYGVSHTYKRIFPDKTPEKLQGDYDKLMIVAGDYINIPPENLKNTIADKFKGGLLRPLQTASLNYFRPAKKENSQIVGLDGNVISSDAVAESPSEIDLAGEDDLDTYPLQNVAIEIRATDLDRKKQGWAAVVNDVTKKRLKMEIYPTVDIQNLIGKTEIKGDIIVVNKRDSGGDYLPNMYHLVKMNDDT